MSNYNEDCDRRKNTLTGHLIFVSPNRVKSPLTGQLRSIKKISYQNLKDQQDLSKILKVLLNKYDNLSEISFPYSMSWQGASTNREFIYWRLDTSIYRPLFRSLNVKKILVKYELMAESQIDLTHKQSYEKFREKSVFHFSESQ